MGLYYTLTLSGVPAGNGQNVSQSVKITSEGETILDLKKGDVYFKGPPVYQKDGYTITLDEYAALSEEEQEGWVLIEGLLSKGQFQALPDKEKFIYGSDGSRTCLYSPYIICVGSWNDCCEDDEACCPAGCAFSDILIGGTPSGNYLSSSSVVLNRDEKPLYVYKGNFTGPYPITSYFTGQQDAYERSVAARTGKPYNSFTCYGRRYASYAQLQADYTANCCSLRKPDSSGGYHVHFTSNVMESDNLSTSLGGLQLGATLRYGATACQYDYDNDIVTCAYRYKSGPHPYIYFGELSLVPTHTRWHNTETGVWDHRCVLTCTYTHPAYAYAVLLGQGETYSGDTETIEFSKVVYRSEFKYSTSDYIVTLPETYPTNYWTTYAAGAAYPVSDRPNCPPYNRMVFNDPRAIDALFYTFQFTGKDMLAVPVWVYDDEKIYDSQTYKIKKPKYPSKKKFKAGDGTEVPVNIVYSTQEVGPNVGKYKVYATFTIDNSSGAYSNYHLEGKTDYHQSVTKQFTITIKPRKYYVPCLFPHRKRKTYDGKPFDVLVPTYEDTLTFAVAINNHTGEHVVESAETLHFNVTYSSNPIDVVCDEYISYTFELVSVTSTGFRRNPEASPSNYEVIQNEDLSCQGPFTICPRPLNVIANFGDGALDGIKNDYLSRVLSDKDRELESRLCDGIPIADGEYGLDYSNVRLDGFLEGEECDFYVKEMVLGYTDEMPQDDRYASPGGKGTLSTCGYPSGECNPRIVRLSLIIETELVEESNPKFKIGNYQYSPNKIFSIYPFWPDFSIRPFGNTWTSSTYDGPALVTIDGNEILYEESFTIRFKMRYCRITGMYWDTTREWEGYTLALDEKTTLRSSEASPFILNGIVNEHGVSMCKTPRLSEQYIHGDQPNEVNGFPYVYNTIPTWINPEERSGIDYSQCGVFEEEEMWDDSFFYEFKLYSQPRWKEEEKENLEQGEETEEPSATEQEADVDQTQDRKERIPHILRLFAHLGYIKAGGGGPPCCAANGCPDGEPSPKGHHYWMTHYETTNSYSYKGEFDGQMHHPIDWNFISPFSFPPSTPVWKNIIVDDKSISGLDISHRGGCYNSGGWPTVERCDPADYYGIYTFRFNDGYAFESWVNVGPKTTTITSGPNPNNGFVYEPGTYTGRYMSNLISVDQLSVPCGYYPYSKVADNCTCGRKGYHVPCSEVARHSLVNDGLYAYVVGLYGDFEAEILPTDRTEIDLGDLEASPTADDKYYDGTVEATVHIPEIILASLREQYGVGIAATGKFESPVVGEHNVTIDYHLTGDDADQYFVKSDTTRASILEIPDDGFRTIRWEGQRYGSVDKTT